MKKSKLSYFIFTYCKLPTACCYLALASLFLLLNSCHKYPEDSFISLKRPFKRLEGTWKFTSYKINGVEHSHDFDNLLSPKTLTDCSVSFSLFDKISGSYKIFDNDGNVVFPVTFHSTQYSFINDYGAIEIYGTYKNDTAFYKPLWKLEKNEKWAIKKLYSNKMHLSYNGTDIYFEK